MAASPPSQARPWRGLGEPEGSRSTSARRRSQHGVDQIVPRALVAEVDLQAVVEEGEEVVRSAAALGPHLTTDAELPRSELTLHGCSAPGRSNDS